MNVSSYITVSLFLLLTPNNLGFAQAHSNWLFKKQEHTLDEYQKLKTVPHSQSLKFPKKTRWNRQNNDDGEEWFIFDEVLPRPSTTQRNNADNFVVPGMGTTQTPCEDSCQTTREYNPACGDDNVTYFNPKRLMCAQKCGKKVFLKHLGRCSVENPFG